MNNQTDLVPVSSESETALTKVPEVAIIILNWNGRTDTLACLASLGRLDYPAYQIIVVDNGSGDDSVASIRSAYSQVTLIETGDNLGYVGGNNVGLDYTRTLNADYALLLNNDTEVSPDFLSLLVEAAEADPAVGIAGPLIYYFDQPERVWSAGGVIDWQRGNTYLLGLNEADHGQFGSMPYPVDYVTGCALLIKMSVVDQVGLLDPRFFAYYEETEWCARVARAGFKILLVPQARIWHKISLVAREASPQVHYYMTRNRLLFLKLTRMGLFPWLKTVFDYSRTLLSWTIKPKWRSKAPQRRAMLQAIRDYRRGNFGRVEVLNG
ncbi:MAG: glycosyltransferase family 2 protein [Anaerolineae bacterium]|nr:glycosyltransferase family 2 protein [Anaerolineae bacterium]